MLVVSITTRDSGVTTVNVPFTHRRGTAIGPSTVFFNNILSNKNITITGHVGPSVTTLHAKIGTGASTAVPIASDGSFAFTTTGTAPSIGDGDPITFTLSDGTSSEDVEFPVKFKRDTAPPTLSRRCPSLGMPRLSSSNTRNS